ncbi:MAG: ABC transporter ATP-binding protein [Candidatus Kariarchaeaceae archaeon]|jgi:ATP-binding cassette subfamily B protein
MLSSSKWVMGYLRKHPIASTFVFITSIIEPLLYMLPLFYAADIIGVLNDGGGWPEVWVYFRILIPLALIQVLLFFTSSFLNEVLAHRITTDMTQDLFATLQDRSLTYHDEKDVGDIMARATNDTRAINMALSPGIRMIIAVFDIWAVGVFILFGINAQLVVIAVIVFILLILSTAHYSKRVAPLSNTVLEELAGISEITNDSISGIRDVKAYTSEVWFNKKFARQTVKHAIAKEREGKLGAWFYPDLIVRIFVFIMIGYGLLLTFQDNLSIRDLVLLTTVMAMVGGMSEEMSWVSFIMVGGYAANLRLYSFMIEEDKGDYIDGTIEFTDQKATIAFDNVTFSYKENLPPALKNVSFQVKDSETVAIVGSPGSGKSTLTKLIQRLYIPQSGEIRIGDIPIGDYSNASLRQQISTVEQDVFLFNETVLENIRFGKPEATLEEVQNAASLAQAHDYISEFSEGYQTLIGENGVRLSGGQAQRIAIARALLMNPDILIFDDGASALDAHTEAQIQNAIGEILKTRTTIITTHRLAIIAKAHKIIILDKGLIVGLGTHEVLIQTNKYYRQLFQRHFELPPLLEVEI